MVYSIYRPYIVCSNYVLGLSTPVSDKLNSFGSSDTQVSDPGPSWPSCFFCFFVFIFFIFFFFFFFCFFAFVTSLERHKVSVHISDLFNSLNFYLDY